MKWIADFLSPVWESTALTLVFGVVLGMCIIAGRGSVVFTAKFIKSLRTGRWDSNGHATVEKQQELDADVALLREKVEHAHVHHAREHSAIVKMLEADRERGMAATKTLGELSAALDSQTKALDRLCQRIDMILASGGRRP